MMTMGDTRHGISAIAAAILCLYSSTKNAAVSAVILLAAIIVVSKILYHLDWKLLLYSGCSYLSALFLLDLIFYLLLCRYFSKSLVFGLYF